MKKRSRIVSSFRRTNFQDFVFIFLSVTSILIYPFPQSLFNYQKESSVRIYDRNGYLLREVISASEGRGRWISFEKISPKCIQAALVAEDRRFYYHRGVDVLALARAIRDNLMEGRIVSGASTISAQLMRNLRHYPRNFAFKIIEFLEAIRLEHTLTKKQILEQYLNRVPFGNQTFGVEAASYLYFGKSSAELTWAESAYLMALPKSPTQYNPYRNSSAAKARQLKILDGLLSSGMIDSSEWDRARQEAIILFPKNNPFYAPHFTDWLLQNNLTGTDIHTTLDLPLQEFCEKTIRGHIQNLKHENVSNAAVLVVENRTGHILVMVGSSDYFDEKHDGQYNAVFALRQPGSALKPFTYALAFERGYTPATIIPDIETVIETENGRFTPLNYDNQFHGPVRARTALACSYNVPAVRIVQKLGPEQLLNTLRQAGFESLSRPAEHYGHGLTLGNGEVTLFELTRAYAMLANGGRLIDLNPYLNRTSTIHNTRVFSELSAFWIASILSDATARAPAFGIDSPLNLPFPCAVKTGTSSDYRDNWTVGYTRFYTVGVWVGNFDNQPMKGISGVTGAGPVFRDIMMKLHEKNTPPPFPVPPDVTPVSLCALSGQLPHQGCVYRIIEYFPGRSVPQQLCSAHDTKGNTFYLALGMEYSRWLERKAHSGASVIKTLPSAFDKKTETLPPIKILFPRPDAHFVIDPAIPREQQSIQFESITSSPSATVEWYLNGRFFGTSQYPHKLRWKMVPGKYILRAESHIQKQKYSEEIRFEVAEY